MADLEKLVEDLSSLTILEASQLKTMLEEKWGVTAASGGMMMAAMPGVGGGAAAVAAEPEEEPTEFNVIITGAGPKKIEVIKVVRALTTLGLKEAKDAVETLPHTLMEAVTKDAAGDAKTKLEAAGAEVQVKPV